MKKKLTLLSLLIISVLSKITAQDCFPDGIIFSTQKQIDNFPYNHPECTQILKDVVIRESIAENITNLDSLYQIIKIRGNLSIISNAGLISLSGLKNLNAIGGNLELWKNVSLTSLSGLDNLTSINHDLNVNFNNTLLSLKGLKNLNAVGRSFYVSSNTSLTSLNGLDNLTSIGGDLKVWKNASLKNLSGLDNLTSIGGYMDVYDNAFLMNLNGLENLTSIGGYLKVWENTSLRSLSGLDNLTSIGGYMDIYYNASLFNQDSLESLTVVGEIIKKNKKKQKPHQIRVIPMDTNSRFIGYLRGVEDSLITVSNRLNKFELNDIPKSINFQNIKAITLTKRGKLAKSFFVGALVGVVIGGSAGLLDGDDIPGQDCDDPNAPTQGMGYLASIGQRQEPCRSAKDKAALGAIGLGIPGALIGGIVGSISINIPINGDYKTFKEQRGELLKFKILK